jgi:mono/diheme cytochrome c family protein
MKALGWILVVLLLLALLWFAQAFHQSERDLGNGGPASAATVSLAQGEYLTRAGNCYGCHTVPGDAPYAGGRGTPTPFGTVYSTNLTPDPETGIGNWSADDFWQAVHLGKSRDGRRLYPAFPYNSYTRMSRADADAIFAYLKSQSPVVRAPTPSELRFPYNQQLALIGWRALFFRPQSHVSDTTRSDSWNRGSYLVQGLGHCDACHSPRNALGATSEAELLAGGPIPMLGWDALPLTFATDDVAQREREGRELRRFLKNGISHHGAASGPMAEVVFQSLQYLSDDDIGAMVEYMQSLPRAADDGNRRRHVADQRKATLIKSGALVYSKHCADCHGDNGEGRGLDYPALAGNRVITAPSANNVIRNVLLGGYPPTTAGNPEPYGMPPYLHQLSDDEIAAVVTYVRNSWGNTASAVSGSDVHKVR